MSDTTKVVLSMAGFRLLSGLIEIMAAILMLKFGNVKTAVQINAALGLVGPSILIIVSLLGVAGLSGKIPATKMVLLVTGIGIILYAMRK